MNLKEEIKKICEFSKNFSLLIVTQKTSQGGEAEFFASGIKKLGCKFPEILFERLFADGLTPDEFVTDACIKDDNMIITCGNVTYTVTPLKKMDTVECPVLPEKIHLETLMNMLLADRDNIKANRDSIYVPLDAQKMSLLSLKQKTRIKLLLEKHLNGAQVKYQCPRVPAFSIRLFFDHFMIYGHLHNIGNNKPLNQITLYDSTYDLFYDSEVPFKDYVCEVRKLHERLKR